MGAPVYVWVPGWEKFQHYRDRDPAWIKSYVRLLSHDGYIGLSLACRGLLHGIWLEYARSGCRLPADTLTLSRRIGQQVLQKQLDSLIHAGFIEILASEELAARYQDASPRARPRARVEVEEEKEKELGAVTYPGYATDATDPDDPWIDGGAANSPGFSIPELRRIP